MSHVESMMNVTGLHNIPDLNKHVPVESKVCTRSAFLFTDHANYWDIINAFMDMSEDYVDDLSYCDTFRSENVSIACSATGVHVTLRNYKGASRFQVIYKWFPDSEGADKTSHGSTATLVGNGFCAYFSDEVHPSCPTGNPVREGVYDYDQVILEQGDHEFTLSRSGPYYELVEYKRIYQNPTGRKVPNHVKTSGPRVRKGKPCRWVYREPVVSCRIPIWHMEDADTVRELLKLLREFSAHVNNWNDMRVLAHI